MALGFLDSREQPCFHCHYHWDSRQNGGLHPRSVVLGKMWPESEDPGTAKWDLLDV